MKKLSIILGILFLLFAGPIMAQGVTDVTDPHSLVMLLNPIIVFVAVQITKNIKSIAPAWLLGAIIPIMSLIGAWLISLISEDSSFWLTFALGLISTFIHQLGSKMAGGEEKSQ